MERWTCRLFQPSLRDGGGVLCCQFPWTEVHGYPRTSLRDFDPRKLTPPQAPPAASPIENSSASLRLCAITWLFGSAFAFLLRPLRLLR
jgi:hypothetical protein